MRSLLPPKFWRKNASGEWVVISSSWDDRANRVVKDKGTFASKTSSVDPSLFPTYAQVTDESTDTDNEFAPYQQRANKENYEEIKQFWASRSFPVKAYRVLALKKGRKPRLRGAGLSWSLSEAAAREAVQDMLFAEGMATGEDGGYERRQVLEAFIPLEAVDWLGTFRAWLSGLEEEEVRVKPKSRLQLVEPKQTTITAAKTEDLKTAGFRLTPEEKMLSDKYVAKGIDISLVGSDQTPDLLFLHAIQVPKEMRKQGMGTAFMEELTALADQEGKTVFLTPSRDFGATSVARLRRFYGRFGFKRNLGRNKDFRSAEAMIRVPKAIKAKTAASLPKGYELRPYLRTGHPHIPQHHGG